MTALDAAPARRLRIAGRDPGAGVWASVIEIRVRQVMSHPTAVELLFAGSPDVAVEVGAELELELGDGDLHVVADVTAVVHHHDSSGTDLLRIRAFDRLHRLRYRQTVRSFGDDDVEAIARTILAGADLDVDGALAAPRLELRSQHRENDLDFLVALLASVGGRLRVDGTTAVLSGSEAGDPTTLTLGVDMTELTRTASNEGVAGEVHAAAWDLDRARAVEVSAGDATAAPVLDGMSWTPDQVRWLHDTASLDVEAARAEAQAVLDRSRARGVRIEGRAVSRPDLRPGLWCTVCDHDGRPLGEHTLVVVDHTLSGAGLVTDISTDQGHAGPIPGRSTGPSASVVRGIVAAVDDPQRRGRIAVDLPTLGGARTPWLDVVHPAAAEGRGLVAVPTVGDVVAVLLPDGDLARGVVLGGVLGTAGPAQRVVDGRRVVRHVWHSSPHQYVELDDAAGAVTVRNRGGSRLTLGPDRVELHGATDLVIAAPGRTITIRAAAVEFEQVPS